MKWYHFLIKYLREAVREPLILAVVLLLPALFVLIFYLPYNTSGSSGFSQMLTVSVINHDQGLLGQKMVAALQSAQFDGQPALSVSLTDDSSGIIALKENKISMLIIIPANFSEAVRSKGHSAIADIQLRGDPSMDLFNFSDSFVRATMDEFIKQQIDWDQPYPVSFEFSRHTGTSSDFQIVIPGLLVFSIMFGIATTSLWIVREEASGMLRRIRLSASSGWDIVIGVSLAQALIAFVQVLIALLAALPFGFQVTNSIGSALLPIFLASLTATGLGFIIGVFVHNATEATTISTIVLTPFVFLSGALFSAPNAPINLPGNQTLNLFDLLPTKQAVDALTRILVFGDNLSQLPYQIGMLTLMTLFLLITGALLFQKIRLEN